MSIARVKSWVSLEVLFANDLNNEFDNIINNGLALVSPLTGNLNVNNNQLVNAKFEVKTATATASGAGRVYWQSTEGAIHVDTGTLIARTPAITGVQEGFLVGTLNPSGVSGATTYALIQLGTGFSLVGNVLTPGATLTSGSYEVRGLVGANTAATPDTQYDLAANLVQLRNPSDGSTVVRTSTGTLTNNIATAGPAANGRDQAAAFGVSTWLHFYFIWNGSTLATVSSTTAPPTGPALPSGYTSWAYAGAVYNSAAPILVKTRLRGAQAFYEVFQNALTTGNAVVETAISLATLVPSNCLSAQFQGRAFVEVGTISTDTVLFRYITGQNFMQLAPSGSAALHTDTVSFEMPVFGQQVFYLSVTTGVPMTVSLDVQGYTMPNGGE